MTYKIILLFIIIYFGILKCHIVSCDELIKNKATVCTDISLDEFKIILNKTEIFAMLNQNLKSINWEKIEIKAEPPSSDSGLLLFTLENISTKHYLVISMYKTKWCILGTDYRVFSIKSGSSQITCFVLDENDTFYPITPRTTFLECTSYDTIVEKSVLNGVTKDLFYFLCLFFIDNVYGCGYSRLKPVILNTSNDIPLKTKTGKMKKFVEEYIEPHLYPPRLESINNGFHLKIVTFWDNDGSIREWDFTMGSQKRMGVKNKIVFQGIHSDSE